MIYAYIGNFFYFFVNYMKFHILRLLICVFFLQNLWQRGGDLYLIVSLSPFGNDYHMPSQNPFSKSHQRNFVGEFSTTA